MNRIYTTIVMALVSLAVSLAQPSGDTGEICQRIDEEIENWPAYLAARRERIDSLKELFFLKNKSAIVQYGLCSDIIDEYSCFQNDSALYYCKMLGEIAAWTQDQSKVEIAKIKMARQAVRSGMYEAAMDYLDKVDTVGLGKEGLTEFWRVRHFAFVEMAAYCNIWEKRSEYLGNERICRQHLLSLLPENEGEWLLIKAYDELLTDHFVEAERYSTQCMSLIPRYGMLYREAAFHRRFICESLNKDDESIYWQAECAIAELRLGMTDQIGLWSVASKLGDDDLEQSYRYIRFSWDVINMFGVNTRSWQIAPVLSTIEHQYQAERERLHRIISDGIIVLAILAVLLALSLLYVNRQRKRLTMAHRQLEERNNQLQESNNQLAAANSQLSTLNSQLSDSSRAKEAYIVQLLEYNSDFIDQKEEERRKASKLLRTDKMKELNKLLNSADKTGKELDMLLARFDEIFLGLYPSFIEDFDTLLREEGRIKMNRPGQMNTPLRIFALMRLGIDKIPDVAKILHCSSQTIYNYRNNLRNSYLGDRDKFEEEVCRIGLRATLLP